MELFSPKALLGLTKKKEVRLMIKSSPGKSHIITYMKGDSIRRHCSRLTDIEGAVVLLDIEVLLLDCELVFALVTLALLLVLITCLQDRVCG